MFHRRISLMALAGLAALTVWSAFAERPDRAQRSPWQILQQMIGPSLVEIEYSRPGVKGRSVWGELVPYGEVWRAGANERTAIEFEDDVLINGQPLKAGPYGLLILPEAEQWTFIFNKDFMAHGSDGYSEKLDVLRVTAKPEPAEHEEWLRYGVTDFEERAATVYLQWERMRCGFRVELVEDSDE